MISCPKLIAWANQLAGRFNAPVWIVGSALLTENPRDIDILVVISDIEFKNRYYTSCYDVYRTINPHKKYFQDMAKLGAWAHKNISGNIDLKVQDESFNKMFKDKLRLRISTIEVPQEGDICSIP